MYKSDETTSMMAPMYNQQMVLANYGNNFMPFNLANFRNGQVLQNQGIKTQGAVINGGFYGPGLE